MRPNIIVTEPEYFTRASLSLMRKAGSVITKRLKREDFLRFAPLRLAHALVIRAETRIDKEVLRHAPNLKCVASATVGLDHIDAEALKERGVVLFSLTGAHTKSTAEHALALLLTTARNIPQAHSAMCAGKWERWDYIGVELSHKVLGIFGMGRVGAELAELSQGFNFTVLGYDPFLSAKEIASRGANKVSFETLLKKSDLISLHAPLTKETEGSFDKKAFASMRRTAILANTGRGALIEEKALLRALQKRLIRAAAIDVYAEEPLPPKHPFRTYARTHKNLVLTPHLGASTHEGIERAALQTAQFIFQFFRSLSASTK